MDKLGFYFHLIVMILEMWGHVSTMLHEFPSLRGFISTQLQRAGVFFIYNALPYYSYVSFLPHVDFLQCNCNIELQQCMGFPSSALPHHITTMWVSFLVWISFNTTPCHVTTMRQVYKSPSSYNNTTSHCNHTHKGC